MNKICIILVEDNIDLCDDLSFQLEQIGYCVDTVGNGSAMDQKMEKKDYSIAILDIGLPGEDGLSIAKRLKHQQPNLGVVMLTARGEIDTKLQGFENGADAYLVKPVDWRELSAVIESLFRRIQPNYLEQSTWQLLESASILMTPQNDSISLTGMESKILTLLAENVGEAVTKKALIEYIDGRNTQDFDPRRLEVCVSRLRQKIFNTVDQTKRKNAPFKSVRGIGYIFNQAIVVKP